MKTLILAACVALAFSAPAAALKTDDLVSLVAMPLAVAAVAEIADVPPNDLVDLVRALNTADVPPPQFVEVVRYSPVALVDTTTQPRFVNYVTTEVDRGLVGDALALSLADRLRVYGAEEINVVQPVLLVEERTILPPLVVNQFGSGFGNQFGDADPLMVAAMPLAVAAVADLLDLPTSDLMNLVMALNGADVPPAQFVEIIRYVPVVLVDRDRTPEFMTFVTTRVSDGVRREALALAIADRLRTYGADEIDVTAPRLVRVVDRDVIPVRVVDTVRRHPHGGPPGQIKKQIGVQTGAEVVHGTRRSDDDDNVAKRVVERRGDDGPGSKGVSPRKNDDRERASSPRSKGRSAEASPGKGNKGKQGKGKGNSGGKGKGKGKGNR